MAQYTFKKSTLTFWLISRAFGGGKPGSKPSKPKENWQDKYFNDDHSVVDSQAGLDAFFRL